jgi:8-oxo-dGTP pyrophosphatase MutT (NUDIX family)
VDDRGHGEHAAHRQGRGGDDEPAGLPHPVGPPAGDRPAEDLGGAGECEGQTRDGGGGGRVDTVDRRCGETRQGTEAQGGLVLSGMAEAVRGDGSVDLSKMYVALIGRLDRRGRLLWSIPKGHVEPNEEAHTTAEREVWEETGISGEVFSDLGTIDYWFVSEGTRIHKTVHHHLLRFVDGDLNDEDPEVTEVAWLPVSHLVERLAYADERKLARQAHDRLPDLARAEAKAGRRTPR